MGSGGVMSHSVKVKYGKIWSRAVTVETCNVLSREVRVRYRAQGIDEQEMDCNGEAEYGTDAHFEVW